MKTSVQLRFLPKKMLADLRHIPTGMLEDMLFAILKAGRLLTPSELAEIEQIQRELEHRAGCQYQE